MVCCAAGVQISSSSLSNCLFFCLFVCLLFVGYLLVCLFAFSGGVAALDGVLLGFGSGGRWCFWLGRLPGVGVGYMPHALGLFLAHDDVLSLLDGCLAGEPLCE